MPLRFVTQQSDRVFATIAWAYLAFAYTIVDLQIAHVTLCPYLLITGSPCPLCGASRLIGKILHGEVGLTSVPKIQLLWFFAVSGLAVFSTIRLAKHLRHNDPQQRPSLAYASVMAVERK